MAVQVLDMGLNCRECDSILQGERGCIEKGIVPFYIDGEQIFKCPLKLITGVSWEYIKAYRFYKDKFLPNSTNWLDESDKFLDAMVVIENETVRMEQEKASKKKRR